MFRDDLAAAHARIDSLERELRTARESATEEASEQIDKLEAELARERRKAAAGRGSLFSGMGFLIPIGIIGAVFIYFAFIKHDDSLEDKCNGGDGHACLGWGIGLERANNNAAAEKAYARACELGDAQGCYNAGILAFREHNDRASAVASFRKACAKDYANACANLSALVEDKPEKLATARKACELGAPLGCTNAASNLSQDKKWKEALPFAQKGCDGGSVGGCQNLAEALAMTGDKTKALAAATRAIHINEQHPSAHATLGSILVINGDVEQAMVHYRRAFALEHNPGGSERPMLDAPIAVSIKKDLEALRAVHPTTSAAIDDVLKRLAALAK